MKKILALLLVAATVLSLVGCAAGNAQPEATQAAPETAATEAPVAETTQPETEPAVAETEPAVEGSLFLTVSGINFSVVGESEDIYLGVIPRELVSWESENPEIVSVEAGVLTATGVGTTTVRATYEDRQVEIPAGCLAATAEELAALDYETLHAPKRLPPEVDLEVPCTYFDNAALVGDSISYFLMQHEMQTNYLGNMLFLARGGISMNGLVKYFKNVFYKGSERYLEDAVSQSGVDRVYFLMGSNDIQSRTQRPFLRDNWGILVERIREKSPDVDIVLMSNIPLYDEEPKFTTNDEAVKTHNDMIVDYNLWLRQFAADNDCLFIDLYQYVEDHVGNMAEIYSQGSYHMNKAGCLNWMKILRYYAQYELEGGILS